MDTAEEGVSETNGESSISIYTHSGVRWTAAAKLLFSTGSRVRCGVMTWKDRMGGGEGRER